MKKIACFIACLFTLTTNAQFKQSKIVSTGNKGEQHKLLDKIIFKSDAEYRHAEATLKPNLSFVRKNQYGDFKILAFGNNGLPLAIEGTDASNKGQRDLSHQKRAENHLRSLEKAMKLENAVDQFELTSAVFEDANNYHFRYQQKWNQIPVYGSEIILHSSRDEFDFVNGRYALKPESLPANPVLNETGSLEKVSADLGGLVTLPELGLKIKQTTSNLVYYEDNNEQFHLAYHHTVYKNLVERWEYFVDAVDGHIINKFESICKFHNHAKGTPCSHTAENEHQILSTENAPAFADGPATANANDLFNISRLINTYQVGSKFYMIDGSRPMFVQSSVLPDDPAGAIWTIDAFNTSPQKDNFTYDNVLSSNNSWTNKTAVSAHFNGGKAYEYFRNVHGRNSINGGGGNIVSLINIADEDGSSLGNAFWNGAAMFYGNGDSSFKPLARGLDVAGHEMTHGVVQNTANLEYQGESGALNESFADVFGSLIDRDDYLIGEDVVNTSAFPSGALRSLSDPHNGAAQNDYNSGFQPKFYSEKFNGSQDNGGVHINSGIPNHAYFLFANHASVGKDKAEKVYYRALSQYLTKSSQFVDCRIAVTRAAKELFGDAIAAIATSAFDQVGIPGGNGGNYETNVEINPGLDLILFTTDNQQDLYLYTGDGQEVANPLTESDPISRPSVSDNGSIIVFVANDKKIHLIQIDWTSGQYTETPLNIQGINQWRNAAISKDGRRLAALKDAIDNELVIFDLETGNDNTYELKNPTFTEGVTTGDVLYADAMEWDFSGEYLMYDAENKIKSSAGGDINYWDIGFIKVWNKTANAFALPDQIEKLFPALEEGLSIGNPTFSKNSPHIIAFDYLENDEFAILGANVENGDVGLIMNNTGIGYPSYSNNDKKLIFNRESFLGTDLEVADLKTNKIENVSSTSEVYSEGAYWGVWFSNGQRNVSTLEVNGEATELIISPNPVGQELLLPLNAKGYDNLDFVITDINGRLVLTGNRNKLSDTLSIDVSGVPRGMYVLKLIFDGQQGGVAKFVKF